MTTFNFLPLPVGSSTSWNWSGQDPQDPQLVGSLYINGDLWNTSSDAVGTVTTSYDSGAGSLTTAIDFSNWIPPGKDFSSGNPAGFPNVSFGLSPFGGVNTSPAVLRLPATLNSVINNASAQISVSYSVQNPNQVPINIGYDTFITQNPAETNPPQALSGALPAYVGNYFELELLLYQTAPINATPVSVLTLPTVVNGQSVNATWNVFVFSSGSSTPLVVMALANPPDPAAGASVGISPGALLSHLSDTGILQAIDASGSVQYTAASIDAAYLDNLYLGSGFFPTQTGGAGNYQAHYSYTVGSFSVSGIIRAKGDFDGDGRSDVLFQRPATGDTGYWTTNAGGQVTGFNDFGQANGAYTLTGFGDFDGDGRADVLFENKATGDTGYWQTNTSGQITGFHDFGHASTVYTIAGVGDFDDDGRADVLFENKTTGDTGYWLTNPAGQVTGFHDYGHANTAYGIVGVGDLDGDARSDVLFQNPTTGDIGYWIIDSSGAVAGFHDFGPPGAGYTIAGVGNFDAGGHDEILFENKANGDTGYWLADGSGAVTGFHDFGHANTAYAIVGVGDYDGDGRADVLFQNKATGDTGYWITNNGGAVTGFHDFGKANTSYGVIGS